ncbi:sensor histidine kinase [Paroceanicella profunda]|uniref:C4-dicarboxylate transport sensor protein DctB n=1 Tax=Paroceanicella profunda TaxID=2579971 RepID=A0A5B8G190_9RHOB|nr:sensor histidine kinase [Paroceanicella profunda]
MTPSPARTRDAIAARRRSLLRRGLAVLAVTLVALLIWGSHNYLTTFYSEDLRNRANVRAAIYNGSLLNVLERHQLIPSVLARDRTLTDALMRGQYAMTSARLIDINDELKARNLLLFDATGRIVASSDRRLLGTSRADRPYFREAARENTTIFTTTGVAERELGFFFAHAVRSGGQLLGVIAVQVNLGELEASWARDTGRVFVTNAEDVVILSSHPDWRYKLLSPLLEEARMAALRSRQLGGLEILPMDWTGTGRQVRIGGATYLRRDVSIGFRGWTLNYLAPLDDVRARVNAVIALEIMAVALLVALIFWIRSKQAWRRFLRLERESAELRDLNRRLSDEILERRRVEQTLARTEQSLVQASKLAALGQMSAAVSHELNQPLAAMRTYIAGARLLIERGRMPEAHSSIQRIDDLIGRMAMLTRQLKSFARKGEDEIRPLDLRDAIKGALSVMSPQLGQVRVELVTDMPSTPVMIRGDQLRIEQILVNLLRNALDALRGQDDRRIDVTLVPGPLPTIRVSDNGPGLPKEPDALFEPFFTTKRPGEGLGLGLAISAGIAQDLGGELTARNLVRGGACFELTLPALQKLDTAAE